MINVNWEVAADGTATRLVTCEDSVYWAKDGHIWHNNGAHWVKSNPDCIFQTLAARPTQTKTVADAEQESEKWTHTYSDYGVRKDCILVHDKPDIHGQVLVLNRYDEYVLTGTVELKPIKPTISEDQAKAVMEFATEHGLISEGQIWTSMERDII